MNLIDRPKRTRVKYTADYDQDIELALLSTQGTNKAVKLSLARFHSSPAKGRLWAKDLRVLHRVLPNKRFVAAWVA